MSSCAAGTEHNVAALFSTAGSTLFFYLLLRSRFLPRALSAFGLVASILLATLAAANLIVPKLPPQAEHLGMEYTGLRILDDAGDFLVVSGYLIVRSGCFPRALGVVLIVAGSGYLIDCFSRFLAPPVAAVLFPWLLLPGFLAELALCGWLLVKGVDVPNWEAAVSKSSSLS